MISEGEIKQKVLVKAEGSRIYYWTRKVEVRRTLKLESFVNKITLRKKRSEEGKNCELSGTCMTFLSRKELVIYQVK